MLQNAFYKTGLKKLQVLKALTVNALYPDICGDGMFCSV